MMIRLKKMRLISHVAVLKVQMLVFFLSYSEGTSSFSLWFHRPFSIPPDQMQLFANKSLIDWLKQLECITISGFTKITYFPPDCLPAELLWRKVDFGSIVIWCNDNLPRLNMCKSNERLLNCDCLPATKFNESDSYVKHKADRDLSKIAI